MDTQQIKTNTSQILNTGKETIREVEKLTLDTLGAASHRISESGKKATQWVKDNPILSVGAFFAIGFLFAKLSNSRKRHA